jgi:two-component system, OmpR family, sensor histidine kinase KdpD
MTTGAAEQLATEADRGRAALLAAVSHDLRAPLAAAKAAVSGLRPRDARLSAGDREELLAAAEESPDLLAHLAASLLDVSRLQAGALAVFPKARRSGRDRRGLPRCPRAAGANGAGGHPVRAAPGHGRPGDHGAGHREPDRQCAAVLSGGSAAAGDGQGSRGPGGAVRGRSWDGIPEADRKRVFLPFQRLGDRSERTGVGLVLVVSRGLAEAMGGTVEPQETPGGGLTMIVSLPAAPARPAARAGGARRMRAA